MKKFTKSILFASIAVLSSLVIFTACDVSDNDPGGGIGKLAVRLTDAPAQYDAVYIDIQSVKVHVSGDVDDDSTDLEDDSADTDDDATPSGWITISDEPRRVDLLQFQNGRTLLLGAKELEADTYQQLRLILGPDNAVVIDGVEYPLQTPSAQQSGLKLNINARVEADEVYTLLVDFNAAKSIVEMGNGKYKLKPVLRAVALEETGSIEGTISPSNFSTEVLAINEADTVSTFVEDDGEFELIGLVEGAYDVVVDPLNESYADTTLNRIMVEPGEDTDLGTINLQEL